MKDKEKAEFWAVFWIGVAFALLMETAFLSSLYTTSLLGTIFSTLTLICLLVLLYIGCFRFLDNIIHTLTKQLLKKQNKM